MSSRTRLVLIRHGHTAGNDRGGRLIGRTDAPLSERGREQVRLLEARLRGTAPFSAIYSSPLRRAYETAAAVARGGAGPLQVCRALQEIDCGALDGLPIDTVRRDHPALWAANERQDDDRFRWPGGESYREFRCRCLRAVRALAIAHRGERIALVTHSGFINQVLGAIHGLSAARWAPYRPANTSLTEIEWGRGAGVLRSYDDHAHLDAMAR